MVCTTFTVSIEKDTVLFSGLNEYEIIEKGPGDLMLPPGSVYCDWTAAPGTHMDSEPGPL